MSGTWVEFRGFVRNEETGRPISVLEYEAYARNFKTNGPLLLISQKHHFLLEIVLKLCKK
jgi:molybdopterin synthase catalytic subunit